MGKVMWMFVDSKYHNFKLYEWVDAHSGHERCGRPAEVVGRAVADLAPRPGSAERALDVRERFADAVVSSRKDPGFGRIRSKAAEDGGRLGAQGYAVRQTVLREFCGNGPPGRIDVLPPHPQDLALPLGGQEKQLEGAGQLLGLGVESVPQTPDLVFGEDPIAAAFLPGSLHQMARIDLDKPSGDSKIEDLPDERQGAIGHDWSGP